MNQNYEELLCLPYPLPGKLSHVSMSDRAAQFSPFAALTDHEEAISETERLTEPRRELDETLQAQIDGRIQRLRDCLAQHPHACFTYFVADAKKDGGYYQTSSGAIQKIEETEGVIVLQDRTRIPIQDIQAVESEIFPRETDE